MSRRKAPGEGGPVRRPFARLAPLHAAAPGAGLALAIAAAATLVANTYGGPVMLMALLMGMALNFVSQSERWKIGLALTSRQILRLGVALLGLRIAAGDVLALGLRTLLLVLLAVLVTILAGIALSRLVGRGRRFGTLIGGATAICGASAALALSSVLPRRPDGERETVFVVIAVTTLSTMAMVIYPALFKLMGYDDQVTGILIGATIHDVAQVVGAGYAVSDNAGDTAAIVKLFRVALLLPVVLAVSWFYAGAGDSDRPAQRPVPLFVVAFAILVAVNSLGIVPDLIREPLVGLSRWCLVAAVAAIGVLTSLQEIARVGYPPVFVAVGTSLVLLVFVMAGLAALS